MYRLNQKPEVDHLNSPKNPKGNEAAIQVVLHKVSTNIDQDPAQGQESIY